MKVSGCVSIYHLVLMSVERYIAIVYPLHYETKFTDRTVKWAIGAAWVAGILFPMTWLLWLINADLRKCNLIPVHFLLTDTALLYAPVCISMLICYGRILAISWRQRHRVEPCVSVSRAAGTSVTITTAISSTEPEHTDNRKYNSEPDAGPPVS